MSLGHEKEGNSHTFPFPLTFMPVTWSKLCESSVGAQCQICLALVRRSSTHEEKVWTKQHKSEQKRWICICGEPCYLAGPLTWQKVNPLRETEWHFLSVAIVTWWESWWLDACLIRAHWHPGQPYLWTVMYWFLLTNPLPFCHPLLAVRPQVAAAAVAAACN